jgi:hypothetical protein
MKLTRTEELSISISSIVTKETSRVFGWRQMFNIEEHDAHDRQKRRRELSRAPDPRRIRDEQRFTSQRNCQDLRGLDEVT